MGKRLLVTGAAGFIASKLVQRLRDSGDEVSEFDIARGQDICNLKQVTEAIRGKDAVFHLAAVADLNYARVYPVRSMEINVQGTWNIAEACRKQRGTVLFYASTICVYGNQEVHPVTEKSLPNPSEIYACSKLAGENVVKGYHLTYGLPYNIMRFATIYGPGTRPALGTHIFMGQALREEPITVHGNGEQTRTLTHVNDLVDAILAVYKSGVTNDIFNMTATEEISALRMAKDIKRLTGSKSEIVFIPQRIGQTFREEISADHIRERVGWKARIGWDDGLKDMLNWFMDTGQVKNIYKVTC